MRQKLSTALLCIGISATMAIESTAKEKNALAA